MTNEEKRIYVVVANTVQNPVLGYGNVTGKGLRRLEDTLDIRQPAGRQIAQACHAVRRMGHSMVIRAVLSLFTKRASLSAIKAAISLNVNYEPITTIILSCRDSFELEHVYNLLRDVVGVEAFKFRDTNFEAYGEGEVTTAFATVPVTPTSVTGVLDYLPLWSPEVTQNKG